MDNKKAPGREQCITKSYQRTFEHGTKAIIDFKINFENLDEHDITEIRTNFASTSRGFYFYLAAELNKFISDNQSEPTQGAACTSSGEG